MLGTILKFLWRVRKPSAPTDDSDPLSHHEIVRMNLNMLADLPPEELHPKVTTGRTSDAGVCPPESRT